MVESESLAVFLASLRMISVQLLLVVMAACGGSSTNSPTTAPGDTGIFFVDFAEVAEHQPLIVALIEDTVTQASTVMSVGPMRFTVSAEFARVIPGWGLGGYTTGPESIEIVVDPSHPELARVLQDRLPQIVAHELHHSVRWRGPGPYNTLLEALVFEGLADHFAFELTGAPLPPWTQTFPEPETDLYLDRARAELDRPFDFEAWFFGIGTDLPQWTGYTLGFRIVRDYMAANPGTSARQLVYKSAESFREVL